MKPGVAVAVATEMTMDVCVFAFLPFEEIIQAIIQAIIQFIVKFLDPHFLLRNTTTRTDALWRS